MDSINQIWPKWHTAELIGKGTFGEVYKAWREEFGERFYSAVKIVRIPGEDEEIRSMRGDGYVDQTIQDYYESVAKGLLNEIKMLELLKSGGNVVNIEEFEIRKRTESVGWDVYIRMEYLQNLNDYRRQKGMDQRDIVRMGIDLCNALESCERHRIVHRDIKPANIFVDAYGSFKLGDFGIARQMEKAQGMLTRKGTMLYMAPELYRGYDSSCSVDIYSLGLVLYRLLNRDRMPFESVKTAVPSYQEKEEAMYRRLDGEQLPPPADADPELARIILKACEYNADKRYQHASELKTALEQWAVRAAGTNGVTAFLKHRNPSELTGSDETVLVPEKRLKKGSSSGNRLCLKILTVLLIPVEFVLILITATSDLPELFQEPGRIVYQMSYMDSVFFLLLASAVLPCIVYGVINFRQTSGKETGLSVSWTILWSVIFWICFWSTVWMERMSFGLFLTAGIVSFAWTQLWILYLKRRNGSLISGRQITKKIRGEKVILWISTVLSGAVLLFCVGLVFSRYELIVRATWMQGIDRILGQGSFLTAALSSAAAAITGIICLIRGVRKAWVLRAVWWIQWCSFTVASYFVFAVSGMAGVSEMFYIGTLTQTAEAALIQYASCYLGE